MMKPHKKHPTHGPAISGLQAAHGAPAQGPLTAMAKHLSPVDPTLGLRDAMKIQQIMALAQAAAVAGNHNG